MRLANHRQYTRYKARSEEIKGYLNYQQCHSLLLEDSVRKMAKETNFATPVKLSFR